MATLSSIFPHFWSSPGTTQARPCLTMNSCSIYLEVLSLITLQRIMLINPWRRWLPVRWSGCMQRMPHVGEQLICMCDPVTWRANITNPRDTVWSSACTWLKSFIGVDDWCGRNRNTTLAHLFTKLGNGCMFFSMHTKNKIKMLKIWSLFCCCFHLLLVS